MAVADYGLSLLRLQDCPVRMDADSLVSLVRAWRKSRENATECSDCRRPIEGSYAVCCTKFYFNKAASPYPVRSIAVPTPGFEFLLPQMKRAAVKAGIVTDQDFLVLPDPIYWQVAATLAYEKVMKFVSGKPLTKRTDQVMPSSRATSFYAQLQAAPLNYGSFQRRSCGKSAFIRQIGLGKRTVMSMRGMIVPDATLSPEEIRMPLRIVNDFGLADKWIVLNRMPSLQPGNFIALKVVPRGWKCECFGIPLEVVRAMNADFDGDECNVYVVPNAQSQAEVASLLGSRSNMGCLMSGIKLAPSQDMLAAYHLHYDEIDFLPYKSRDLAATMRVVYDLYGSEKCFECFDRMREFYRERFQNATCFALTLKEMKLLYRCGRESPTLERFRERVESMRGCLATQVASGAKGSVEHLYQMFGKLGWQNSCFVESCFFKGLTPVEFVHHAMSANEAMRQTGKIWEPGYGYSKTVFNLQGLHVDYLGRLMDGKTVVERDALDVLHHTDLMSEEAFAHLLSVGGAI